MANAESFEIKNTNILSEDDLNGHIVKLKTNSEELFTFADSESPMSFLNEKIARRLQRSDKSALFKCIPPDDTAGNLACYNGETINPKGKLIITIESEGTISPVYPCRWSKNQHNRTQHTPTNRY